MKIARIDMWHVAVPLPAPFHPSWIPGFPQTENRFDLVRFTTASGIEGWAAAPAMAAERDGWGGLLGSYLLSERADDLANIRQRIREMGYLGYKAGWIEPAFWDIAGKARGEPVWSLLGGEGGEVELYASTGEVRSGPERVEEVARRLEEGFAAIKLRVHADTLDEDLDQIRTTREAHPDAILGVDCNMAWRATPIVECARWDYERALRFCQEAGDLDFAWVEEPLPMDDFEGLARLTAATKVKIAGGELNNHALPEFRIMLEKGCYDWYQPDAVMTGGISETFAIIARIQAAGAKYTPHTWTNGIGFAINLHLFAASGDRTGKYLEYPIDPPGWVPQGRDGVLTQPWLHERGRLTVPTGPGLGFEIDRGALRRFGKKFHTSTRVRVAVRTILDRGLSQTRTLGERRLGRLAHRSAQLDAMKSAGEDPWLDPLQTLTAAQAAPAAPVKPAPTTP